MGTGVQLYVACKKYRIWFLSMLLVAEFATGIGVKLDIQDAYVIMDNGAVQVTLSKPDGMITGIRYNGVDNLLATTLEEPRRGYWDLNWNDPEKDGGMLDVIHCTEFKVIVQTEDQVEVSFIRPWNPSLKGGDVAPLNIDKRFIMLEGSNGFYTYSIYERLKGWPAFSLGQTRIAFKLSELFRYMAVDNVRQGKMPTNADRNNGKPLEYKEAVQIIDPSDLQVNKKVDDKYQWSARNDENKVHGWVGRNAGRSQVGFWQITPSYEYRLGGPFKQELTSHCGPTSLTVRTLSLGTTYVCTLDHNVHMFVSTHYMGENGIPTFTEGEYWKKVYGPVFIYLNSGPPGTQERALWDDAYTQMEKETQLWPYNFPASEDFPKSDQRGSVDGRLLVYESYLNKEPIPAASAYIGLASPGNVGSWQAEGKGYQFWTRTDPDGSFAINNIRAGAYNLYVTIPGFIGDFMSNTPVTIMPGKKIELGSLQCTPPRAGPTLWEIGYPDRTAAEFFIPDPNPNYFDPVLIDKNRFRQYGLWKQYVILYPNDDVVYTINSSDYKKDWFFCQATRKIQPGLFTPTTWKIKFNLNDVQQNGFYTLRIALASSSYARLEVNFNDLTMNPPHFSTGLIGKDNALARHGIHGMYTLFSINVPSAWLVKGENVIFLTQSSAKRTFKSVMYDYIRFEGPSVV